MYEIKIPEYALHLLEQRGRPAAKSDDIEMRRCALLVVDMQNVFVSPDSPLQIPYAHEIVPAINRLARALRQRGATICWIQNNFRDEAKSWSVWFNQRLCKDAAAALITTCSPGHPGYELFSELDVSVADLLSVKTRFSAFIQGSSDLNTVLRSQGIDTVVITGTVTNVCCESTARDAMMLNYRTIFVSDANATRTAEEHNATLANMVQCFADVVSTDELIRKLSPS